MWRSSSSIPSSCWMCELLTLSLRLSPVTLQRSVTTCIRDLILQQLPKPMTTGEGWNKDGTINLKLCLLAQLLLYHNWPEQHPHYCWQTLIRLSISHSQLAITREQDPKILKLLHLRKNQSTLNGWELWSQTGRGRLSYWPLNTAVNCSSVRWVSWLKEPSRTTSFAKRLPNPSLPDYAGSCPLNTTSRISDM